MSAEIRATLIITAAPTSGSKRDGTHFACVKAREGDDKQAWQLVGLSPASRAAISKLKPGATVFAKGQLAIRIAADGAPTIAINVERLSRPPKPKAPKTRQAGHGTRLATPSGVEAAQRKWHEKHGGFAP
jgi:hypothetical protein